MRFSTSRLEVRECDAPLEPLLETQFGTLLAPAVLAHLPPPLQIVTSPDEWLRARQEESDVLLVSQKAEQKLIGVVLLARFEDDVHLGYLIAEQAWGKGYATELIQGLTPELFRSGALRLIGGVGINNPASARVLEKAGFQKDEKTPTQDIAQYVLRAPDGG